MEEEATLATWVLADDASSARQLRLVLARLRQVHNQWEALYGAGRVEFVRSNRVTVPVSLRHSDA